jgi:REP element-mobilizing transposase RayT
MVHGYHVILPVYGFWLPNDPRGSWSKFVAKWEIARFGKPRRTHERRSLRELSVAEIKQRDAARAALKYPPVRLSGVQARCVGRGFAQQVQKSGYIVWACAIMPEHTHLVLDRHRYAAEQMANLLRGAATRQLMEEGCHPLADFAEDGQRPPGMWAARPWKFFLDSDEAIMDAIHYVQNNPIEEGKPPQHWNFVTPYAGLPGGHTTYV